MKAPRFQVRRSTYRDVHGWTVSGPRCRVFFEHESAARRFVAILRNDPDYNITMIDFEP